MTPCPCCGWTEGHPVDCPEYVARPEPPLWSELSRTHTVESITVVSAIPGHSATTTIRMRRLRVRDFLRPMPN